MAPLPLPTTASGQAGSANDELLERHPHVAASIRLVLSRAQGALLLEDPAPALAPTLEAIHALIESVASMPPYLGDARPGPPPRRSHLSGYASSDSQHEDDTSHNARELAGQMVNNELLRLCVRDKRCSNLSHLVVLVELLYALRELIRPQHFAFDWWDLLLRPVLKSEAVGLGTAAKSRNLALAAMCLAPKSYYTDEPRPQDTLRGKVLRDALFDSLNPNSPPSSMHTLCGRARSSSEPGTQIAPSSVVASSWHGERNAKAFVHRVFDLYISEFATLEGELGTLSAWKYNLQEMLLQFGERTPTRFFHHVAENLSRPEARLVLLELLFAFFTMAPNLIYLVTLTKLVQKLIWCLEVDTSTAMITAGLQVVTMLVPHVPDWIASGGAGGLPAFFFVLARVLHWSYPADHGGNSADEEEGGDLVNLEAGRRSHTSGSARDRPKLKPGFSWDTLTPQHDQSEVGVPDPQPLFTFLYGMFPCNTIRFVRDPVVYLEGSQYESPYQLPWSALVNKNRLQESIRPILKRHALHPALVLRDAQEELTDKMRWEEHDADTSTFKSVRLYIDPHRQPTEGFPTPTMSEQSPAPYSSSPFESPVKRQASPRPPLGTPAYEVEAEDGALERDALFLGQHASVKRGTSKISRTRSNTLASSAPLSRTTSSTMISPHQFMSKLSPATRDMSASSGDTGGSGVNSDRMGAKQTPLRGRRSLRETLLTERARSSGAASATKVEPVLAVFSNTDEPSSGHFEDDVDPTEETSPAQLQRENMLLRRELAYELFLQGQHFSHIGHVHKKRVVKTAALTEDENRKHRVRQLTDQLSEAEHAYRLEHDRLATAARGYKAWQASQGMRFTSHSQKERTWRRERAQLLTQIDALTAETKRLGGQVQLEAQEKERLRAELELQRPEAEQTKAYGERVRQLTAALSHWDQDVAKYRLQRQEMLSLLSRWDTMARQYATAYHRMVEAEKRAEKAQDDASGLAQYVAQLQQTLSEQQKVFRARLDPPDSLCSDSDLAHAREQGRQEEHQRVSRELFEMQCELDTLRIYEQMAAMAQRPDQSDAVDTSTGAN